MKKKFQQGASFLQNFFFIAGIVTCIVAVMTYLDKQKSSIDDGSETTGVGTQKKSKKEQENPTQKKEEPPKSTGTKIGHYTAYTNGTAVDSETGMMWSRCSIGQKWDSEKFTCSGKAEIFTWEDTFKAIEKLNQQNYLGYNNWQLPHIEDLSNLRYCSNGFKETITIPTKTGGKKAIENYCIDGIYYQKPAIDKRVFPNTAESFYWSSSPFYYSNYDLWGVGFDDGGIGNGVKNYGKCVRVVRSK